MGLSTVTTIAPNPATSHRCNICSVFFRFVHKYIFCHNRRESGDERATSSSDVCDQLLCIIIVDVTPHPVDCLLETCVVYLALLHIRRLCGQTCDMQLVTGQLARDMCHLGCYMMCQWLIDLYSEIVAVIIF